MDFETQISLQVYLSLADFETQISLLMLAPPKISQKRPLKNISPGAYFRNFTVI